MLAWKGDGVGRSAAVRDSEGRSSNEASLQPFDGEHLQRHVAGLLNAAAYMRPEAQQVDEPSAVVLAN
eukprot:12901303-Prorocentrum_lima.AAC.1